ncbi:nucleoside hydrolase-like domain-containing protein [uncultured Polaribacter sp.]|uniref:nucleoside hydrolase-like domain-containing protein n=1 Tax=uncultured Polaribacter sp. TaxID=174711 RepID=UPI00262B0ACA|nr:nucleoside hydrolase-like domain-containing protein [uncultured Polaribacter sp.]
MYNLSKVHNTLFIFTIIFFVGFGRVLGQSNERTRLIILADMGCEPDEMQQMVHMLMCSNEFELEGLLAVTGKYINPGMKNEYHRITHPELFTQLIDAYSKVYPNLQKHASGWHTPEYLHSIVCAGQKGYGITDVGEGKSSDGSKLLAQAFEKDDERPIWIVVNAGSNTLAQALYDYELSHSTLELHKTISKLRVFENGAQDNAGAYICKQYPAIHWIRSNYQTYSYGGPKSPPESSTLEIGPHFWGEYDYSYSGQNDWLIENVMKHHGSLGALYPERRFGKKMGFMEGGGTVPWIGLVNKGLFDINHPSWGGWGGRYSSKKQADVWSRHQSVRVDEIKYAPFYAHNDVSDSWFNKKDKQTYNNNFVPVWRWREAMYNDFICRMDWCTQPFDKVNHHPKALFFDDASDAIIFMKATPGQQINLDASRSTDPDKDTLDYSWWIYKEAGTYSGDVRIEQPTKAKTVLYVPTGAATKEIHLILEVKDNNPIASLFDYRRIVISVGN